MRVLLSSDRELDVLIRAVREMSQYGSVAFEFGVNGLELAYNDVSEQQQKAIDNEGLKRAQKKNKVQMQELLTQKEKDEYYASGRIDSLMDAFDMNLLR